MILTKLNKRGAALLQVLMLAAVLAGMATMILRVTLSRQVSANQSRHQVKVQKMMESCMAEVNMFWSSKTPTAYGQDLASCQMCNPSRDGAACSPSLITIYTNRQVNSNLVYACTGGVFAVMSGSGSDCRITYEIPGGTDL